MSHDERPVLLTGNHAVAWAARLARPQVVPVYPITPQTPVLELLTDFQAEGHFDAEIITPESEHSVMSACIPASLAGVRVFTATASQGLLLMHELLHYAAGARAPIVMANVNRTVASPWAFWPDQTDSVAQRDTGWIQFYVESAQEALDTVIQAFRIAEQVLLPVMVNLDAFYVSHALEPVSVPAQARVDAYLPPFDPPQRLDTAHPSGWGNVVTPDMYNRHRQDLESAMGRVPVLAAEADRDWAERTGRSWGVIERYRCDGAATVIVAMGSLCGTAREAVDALRDAGQAVGLLKLRLFRPLPAAALRAALAGVDERGRARPQPLARLRRRAAPGTARRALRHARGAAHPRLPGGGGRHQRRARTHRRLRAAGAGRSAAAAFRMGPVNTMPSLTPSPLRSDAPLLCPGHAACPGCAEPLTLRHILDVLGPDTMAVIPPSCMAIIAGPQPYSSLRIPVYQPTLEASAAAASGLRRALDAKGQHDTQVIVLAGDGGTYDIGFQCLSSAAERNENILYFCLDNEGYMNTGAQKSSSTPHYARTGSTPAGKTSRKKNLLEIMAAHGIPYAASASIGHLDDLRRKVRKAKAICAACA